MTDRTFWERVIAGAGSDDERRALVEIGSLYRAWEQMSRLAPAVIEAGKILRGEAPVRPGRAARRFLAGLEGELDASAAEFAALVPTTSPPVEALRALLNGFAGSDQLDRQLIAAAGEPERKYLEVQRELRQGLIRRLGDYCRAQRGG